MTQATLRAVTLKTVANYAHAAERAVGAYRVSGQRLIAVVQRGIGQAADRGAERFTPRLAAVLRQASVRAGGLAAKGLEAVSNSTERAIEMGKVGVSAQLKRVAELAEGVDNRVVANGLQAAVRISLPGARAALALSERLAAGAAKLPGAAGRAAPSRPRKAAKAQVKRASAAATQVKKTVAEAASKVAPKSRRKSAVKSVAAQPAPKLAVVKSVKARRQVRVATTSKRAASAVNAARAGAASA